MQREPTSTAIPAGIRRSTTYFPELESLRGIAIVLVFVFHADGLLLFPFSSRDGSWPSPPLAFVFAGHTGVTLFFILSAFLLGLPFLKAAYGGRPVSWRQFYGRRALRILPLYYAAVVAGAVLTATHAADLWRGVPYLFFLESRPSLVTPMPPWSIVWWSLATEVQFYVLLPLAAIFLGRSLGTTLVLVAVYAVAYVALAVGWVLPALEPWFRAQSILGRGPLFLWGLFAAWIWLRYGVSLGARLAATRWLAAGGGDALLVSVLLVLGVLLRWAAFHGFYPLEVSPRHVWHVLEGGLWTLALLIVLLVPLASKALWSNRLFAHLGVLSYSIYVLHVPVLHYTLALWRSIFPHAGLGWTAYGSAWFALATLLCVGLSSLTYRWIEYPFLVRKARLDSGAPAPRAHAA